MLASPVGAQHAMQHTKPKLGLRDTVATYTDVSDELIGDHRFWARGMRDRTVLRASSCSFSYLTGAGRVP